MFTRREKLEMTIPKTLLLCLYESMLRQRFSEEKIVLLYGAGKISGLAHPYTGQEAVAAGFCAALEKDEGPTLVECLTYLYRGHGAYDIGLDYRTQEEIDEWRSRNPIESLHMKLMAERLATDAELSAIRMKVQRPSSLRKTARIRPLIC
jgi:TPP-dependent pyruvate/acetoin dehydrogenase alpha subunit